MEKNISVFIVSDSLGETARALARATISQFENKDQWDIRRFPYINNIELLEEVLNDAKTMDALVLYSIVSDDLAKHAGEFCEKIGVEYVDLLSSIIEKMSEKSGLSPLREAGLIRKMDKSYFNRVEAIEFAVKYDDGKDPRGLLKADLVLVGISRTSKTPLSMYLANKHIKVANVPLVPEVPIPKELSNVDPKKIIGLTNSPEKLNTIRVERLKSMGLSGSANYAKLDRILEELDYSEKVMKTLKCPVINVANKAIEETAGIILDILKENGLTIIKDYDI
ncbi:pyruvate, water dikinase regulatory protein [Peptostreptococcus canis]|uniref:Putative pyruvate, phosphate dikinase regulatory protein n=1 Tax=Peptostreptococcus canis TaxID=1159213 RepID=A0ABR6TKE9_9FIRM|nr:pyruvate, water dikinase regulatory protein [Peptostreptococcus canis]MBC2575881.1 kinase/pyrophosphorylase [Peptostreptococcus canis]MBP1997998.1 regulator of PEP synthase PpsR (kinase-PPPase family) [Peptostreptococcus canis]